MLLIHNMYSNWTTIEIPNYWENLVPLFRKVQFLELFVNVDLADSNYKRFVREEELGIQETPTMTLIINYLSYSTDMNEEQLNTNKLFSTIIDKIHNIYL